MRILHLWILLHSFSIWAVAVLAMSLLCLIPNEQIRHVLNLYIGCLVIVLRPVFLAFSMAGLAVVVFNELMKIPVVRQMVNLILLVFLEERRDAFLANNGGEEAGSEESWRHETARLKVVFEEKVNGLWRRRQMLGTTWLQNPRRNDERVRRAKDTEERRRLETGVGILPAGGGGGGALPAPPIPLVVKPWISRWGGFFRAETVQQKKDRQEQEQKKQEETRAWLDNIYDENHPAAIEFRRRREDSPVTPGGVPRTDDPVQQPTQAPQGQPQPQPAPPLNNNLQAPPAETFPENRHIPLNQQTPGTFLHERRRRGYTHNVIPPTPTPAPQPTAPAPAPAPGPQVPIDQLRVVDIINRFARTAEERRRYARVLDELIQAVAVPAQVIPGPQIQGDGQGQAQAQAHGLGQAQVQGHAQGQPRSQVTPDVWTLRQSQVQGHTQVQGPAQAPASQGNTTTRVPLRPPGPSTPLSSAAPVPVTQAPPSGGGETEVRLTSLLSSITIPPTPEPNPYGFNLPLPPPPAGQRLPAMTTPKKIVSHQPPKVEYPQTPQVIRDLVRENKKMGEKGVGGLEEDSGIGAGTPGVASTGYQIPMNRNERVMGRAVNQARPSATPLPTAGYHPPPIPVPTAAHNPGHHASSRVSTTGGYTTYYPTSQFSKLDLLTSTPLKPDNAPAVANRTPGYDTQTGGRVSQEYVTSLANPVNRRSSRVTFGGLLRGGEEELPVMQGLGTLTLGGTGSLTLGGTTKGKGGVVGTSKFGAAVEQALGTSTPVNQLRSTALMRSDTPGVGKGKGKETDTQQKEEEKPDWLALADEQPEEKKTEVKVATKTATIFDPPKRSAPSSSTSVLGSAGGFSSFSAQAGPSNAPSALPATPSTNAPKTPVKSTTPASHPPPSSYLYRSTQPPPPATPVGPQSRYHQYKPTPAKTPAPSVVPKFNALGSPVSPAPVFGVRNMGLKTGTERVVPDPKPDVIMTDENTAPIKREEKGKEGGGKTPKKEVPTKKMEDTPAKDNKKLLEKGKTPAKAVEKTTTTEKEKGKTPAKVGAEKPSSIPAKTNTDKPQPQPKSKPTPKPKVDSPPPSPKQEPKPKPAPVTGFAKYANANLLSPPTFKVDVSIPPALRPPIGGGDGRFPTFIFGGPSTRTQTNASVTVAAASFKLKTDRGKAKVEGGKDKEKGKKVTVKEVKGESSEEEVEDEEDGDEGIKGEGTDGDTEDEDEDGEDDEDVARVLG